MNLGRRGRNRLSAGMQQMVLNLNTVIQVGIQYGFFPKTFSSLINNNANSYHWQNAIDKAQEDGFEFMTLQKYRAENTMFNIGKRQLDQVASSNRSVWKSSDFQRFKGTVQYSQLSFRGRFPILSYAFMKIFETMIRQRINMSSETQMELARISNLDLSKKVSTSSQNQNCQCVQTEINGLSGGQIAEPNKVNWGNVAKTLFLGVTAGYGTHKAIEHFSKPKKSTGLSGLSAGQRKGYNKLKKITARAKQIQKANPRKKWTRCISQASKELK